MSKNKTNSKELLTELKRLARVGNVNEFNINIDVENLSQEEQEFAGLLGKILKNYKTAVEGDLVKYRLTSNALGIAHWDMDVIDGNPVDPNNTFTWSREFRHMVGFTDENDFPNVLSSWSDRIHPDDKKRVLGNFATHLQDTTGNTSYDLEYRMKTKSGEYRSFHAVGLTMRDESGRPLKVAGALEDITDRLKQQEMLENLLNTMDSYIYTSDLETDEMLFVNKKMAADFGLTEQGKGEKCWQHLQEGQTGRCSWCTKGELLKNPDKPITWEEDNPVSGNSLYKIDRIIDWPGGRKVHMQQALDITEIKQTQRALIQQEKILNTINRASIIILSRQDDAFEEAMTEGINLISGIAEFNKMSVYRNHDTMDGRHFSQIYRWGTEFNGAAETLKQLADMAYADLVPRWERILEANECINGIAPQMPEAKSLKQFGCVTVLAVPIMNDSVFWGFALFERTKEEKPFAENEIDMLRSAGFMLANVIIRHAEAKKIREADEYMRILLDATPLASRLWDRNFNLIECNEAAVKMFGLKNKREYKDRYFELSPEYQDGMTTRAKIIKSVSEAFEKGDCIYEWTYCTLDGTPIPAENTMVRVPYGDDYVVAAYSRDLREHKKMMSEIEQRDNLLQAVNHVADILLRSEPEEFFETLYQCMGMMTRVINADRM
jgi:PAS domain S-box-containing protein